MAASPAFHTERWLRDQGSALSEFLIRAADELLTVGVRVLAGSNPPVTEANAQDAVIRLTPLRFSRQNGNSDLSFTIKAAAHRGPPRYIVSVETNQQEAADAVRKSSARDTDVWKRLYLRSGLWLSTIVATQPLNHISDVTDSLGSNIAISAVFVHSDLTRTVQSGVMLIGVLYRSLLDEFSGVSKARMYAAQLEECLGGHLPKFQRTIRP